MQKNFAQISNDKESIASDIDYKEQKKFINMIKIIFIKNPNNKNALTILQENINVWKAKCKDTSGNSYPLTRTITIKPKQSGSRDKVHELKYLKYKEKYLRLKNLKK
jgi:hypothetical protein